MSRRVVGMIVAVAAVAMVAPLGGPSAQAGQPVTQLVRDVTGVGDQRVIIPAHAPVPSTGDGIGPGSRLFIEMDGGAYLCSANFIFTDGVKQYLGTAGHCLVPPGHLATHGPGADWNAADTSVSVCISGCIDGEFIFGTDVPLGPVVYGRQPVGGTFGPDFGIIEIPASLAASVRPSMPMWGGPTSTVTTGNQAALKTLCHHGNGTGVGAVFPTKGRIGLGLGGNLNEWSAELAAAPGDSGSGVVTCGQDANGVHGQAALGVLTTISAGVPVTTIKGTTVPKAISMVAVERGLSISIVLGS